VVHPYEWLHLSVFLVYGPYNKNFNNKCRPKQNMHSRIGLVYTVGSKWKPFTSKKKHTIWMLYTWETIKKYFYLFILNNIYLWKMVLRLAIVWNDLVTLLVWFCHTQYKNKKNKNIYYFFFIHKMLITLLYIMIRYHYYDHCFV